MKTKLFTYLFLVSSLFLSADIFAQCAGGTVSAMNGDTIVYTCANDGIQDIVNFTHVTSSTSNYAYIVTNDQNVVLGLPPGSMADVTGAGVGTCRVYGISFADTAISLVVGDTLGITPFVMSGCFELSSNFLEVRRDVPLGGTVSAMNGDTVVYTCANDGIQDIVSFSHATTSSSKYRYVVTNDQNVVLGIPPGNMADVTGAGVGTCRVFGVSFTGNVTLAAGDTVGATAFSDECFDWSSNFLEVRRDVPLGGTVSAMNGDTVVYTCANDGIQDIVSFSHATTSSSKYRYVVTNDQNVVLGIPPGNMADVTGAGVGTCRVFGVSFTGNVTLAAGDTVGATAFSDECFDWSSNFLEVRRDVPLGGTVSAMNGDTVVYTCANDGVQDIVSFTHATTSSSKYRYVVTNDQNVVLGIPPGNMADVTGASYGTCRVFGVSFTGNITLAAGDTVGATAFSDECFDWSSNFLAVVRDSVSGGTVADDNGNTTLSTIAGDGVADVINFTHVTGSNANYAYVITNSNNEVLGLPGNMADLEGAGVGVCRVFGVSFTGSRTIVVGDTVGTTAFSDDCFDWSSNFIEVTRDAVTGIEDNVDAKNVISAYPNPVANQFTIVTEEFTAQHTLNVIDLSGKTIIEKTISNKDKIIDVSTLNNGIYFVKINGSEINAVIRIVKN